MHERSRKRFRGVAVGLALGVGAGVGIAACSAFTSTSESGGNDAGSDGEVNQDAIAHDGASADGAVGVVCQGDFGAPALVLLHNGQYNVSGATLSANELVALVTLNPVNAASELRAVFAMYRTDVNAPFTLDTSVPLNLTESGPTPGAFDVGLTADDQALYFSHRQDLDAGVLSINIYVARRDGPDAATFTQLGPLGSSVNETSSIQFHPHPAGTNLYFTVSLLSPGVIGDRDIYVAPIGGSTSRAKVGELNLSSNEANPVPSPDELEIFFSSDRDNDAGITQVYVSDRKTASAAFSTPAVVTIPGTGAGTSLEPEFLSADRCRLYFVSGAMDLYVSKRAQ